MRSGRVGREKKYVKDIGTINRYEKNIIIPRIIMEAALIWKKN